MAHNNKRRFIRSMNRDMSSKNNSGSNKQNSGNYNNNFNPFVDGITLAQSAAIALINTYSEVLKTAPKMIEYWYNMFWNTYTTTKGEEKIRDKVNVE